PVVSVQATSENRPTYADHAHNILLTFAAEEGVPAALFLVALSIHLGFVTSRARRRLTRARRPADAAVVSGLAAALLAVMGQGLVDYTLRNSVILTTVFLVIGLLAAMGRLADQAPLGALGTTTVAP